jgi:hypothetical protein
MGEERSATGHGIESQPINRGGGRMDFSHARSHMSGCPNGGFITDHERNGIEVKEV